MKFIGITCLILTARSSHAQGNHESTHGTLITVMGNKQGMVVVADSTQSYVDRTGHLQQSTVPAQKLMQYDDGTVCATAGLLTYVANKKSEPPSQIILPQLTLQVLGIVQAYRDAVKGNGQSQPMPDTLEGLSGALRGRFTILADLDSYLGHLGVEIINNYHLQLRLAGFDVDGEPKIGSLDLIVTRQPWPDGQMHWTAKEVERPKVEIVHDALLVRSAGIDQTEKEMLNYPERFTSATIMQDYIKAMQKDKGASLSTEYMRKLGHLFKLQTGYSENAVGGGDQLATIVRGRKPELDGLSSFPPIRPPVQLKQVLCHPGSGLKGSGTIGTESRLTVEFQSCTFDGLDVVLGSNLFLRCVFRNASLIYDGGDILFDDDNIVEASSRLAFLQNSIRRPDLVKLLSSKFDFVHGGNAFPNPTRLAPKP